MVRPARIGVLALQGDVQEHVEALRRAGASPSRVRALEELEAIDGLIIPGGESSVVGMLLERYGLMERLRQRVAEDLPVYGTCAGLILMARESEGSDLPRLGCLDVAVRRNAFGRQVDSFETDLAVPAIGPPDFRGVFIRAPIILTVGDAVEVLARIPEGPVLVRQGRMLGGAFHPELTDDLRLHRYFLDMVGK
jgi:5'-phosphate synthase pdxT subunit